MLSIRSAVMLGAALIFSSSALADGVRGGRGSVKDEVYAPTQPTWYVRIDGTYASYDDPNMVEAKIADLVDTQIDSTWSIGGGIGRYFSPNVRGDITWDHRFESDVTATRLTVGSRRFGLEGDVILANLYYDFYTGDRITPYIGIGLGAVNHSTSRGTALNCLCTDTIEGNDNWQVAGALMSGFSLNIGRRSEVGGSIKDEVRTVETKGPFHLDFGYRFLYLGEARTGVLSSGGSITVEDIHAHEFRVGLRWDVR